MGHATGHSADASMEPLPKERSDSKSRRAIPSARMPQWSRSRRSGATPVSFGASPSHPMASMEPLPKERSDENSRKASIVAECASMEPLPKEQSDVRSHSGCELGCLASMEPLPKERSDAMSEPISEAPVDASMEPLPKERSDVSHCADVPPAWRWPQWSRSRRSGATLFRLCLPSKPYPASMEPLPKERSDRWQSCTRRMERYGLNGAAPEGAERRLGASVKHSRFEASMEPLPKERSDAAHAARLLAGDPRLNGAAPEGAERHPSSRLGVCVRRPQWSRSRRSGATPMTATRSTGRPWASMEPLPKERSDRLISPFRTRLDWPQWSRSRRSGATLGPRCWPGPGRRSLNGAAPEGAERRSLTATRLNLTDMPQWSRSRRSGATDASRHLAACSTSPQWSRSRRSGATPLATTEQLSAVAEPQWSRSRRSGATWVARSVSAGDRAASMEPLPKERSDPGRAAEP